MQARNKPGYSFDVSAFLPLFLSEADQHLTSMGEWLAQLEQEPAAPQIAYDAFKAIHTVKGSAAMVGATRISEVAAKIEALIAPGKVVRSAMPADELVVIRECVAGLHALTRQMQTEGITADSPQVTQVTSELLERILPYTR